MCAVHSMVDNRQRTLPVASSSLIVRARVYWLRYVIMMTVAGMSAQDQSVT